MPSVAQPERSAASGPVPRLRGVLKRSFGRYAKLCSARPKTVMFAGFVFILCSCIGFVRFEVYSAEDLLRVKDSYTSEARSRQLDMFAFDPISSSVSVFFHAKGSTNLFELDTLLEIGRRMDGLTTGLTTPSGEAFAEVCEKSWRGVCEAQSLFHQFRVSAGFLGANITAQPGMGEVEGLAHAFYQFCSESAAACDAFLETQVSSTMVPTPGRQAGAGPHVASLSLTMYLDVARETAEGASGAEEWKRAVLAEVHGPGYRAGEDNLQTDDFFVTSWSTLHNEFENTRAAGKDTPLMLIALFLINVFLWSTITATSAPRSRGLLAATCMVLVVLALCCGVCLSAYMGVPYTTVTPLAIFTLFGVSVDDIVVLVHAYDRLSGATTLEDMPDRMAESLEESGPAILLTSATSAVAFLCSALAPLRIVSWFCITAALGVLSVFVVMMTVFLPLFILDEERRLRGRRDCCLSACLGPARSAPVSDASDKGAQNSSSVVVQILTAPSVNGGFGIFESFGKLLEGSRGLRNAILIAFAAVLGLSIWGASRASTEIDLKDYWIADSYAIEHMNYMVDLWRSPQPLYVNIEHQAGEGAFEESRQASLESMYKELRALDFTQEPYFNWLWDFEVYVNSSAEMASLRGDDGAFGARVAEFLDAPAFARPDGSFCVPWMHKRDVVLEGGVVRYSRVGMMYDSDWSVQAVYIRNFHTVMDIMFPDGHDSKLENPRVPNTFGITDVWKSAERDDVMKKIIYQNMGIASAAVAVTVMVLHSKRIGAFVGALVLALDAIIVALLVLIGSKLDVVAFIALSMNIGLVVDYSTHTAIVYFNHPGSPQQKLYMSVSKMGASVCSGGSSTLLGICVLLFASAKAFQAFAYTLGFAVVTGTLMGITVCPTLLYALHHTWISSCSFRGHSRCEHSIDGVKEPSSPTIPL